MIRQVLRVWACIVGMTIVLFSVASVRADWFYDFNDRLIPQDMSFLSWGKGWKINTSLSTDAQSGYLRLRDRTGLPPDNGGTLEGDAFNPEVLFGGVRVAAKINIDGTSNDRVGLSARHSPDPTGGGYSAFLNLSYNTTFPGRIVLGKSTASGEWVYVTSPNSITDFTRSYFLELSVTDSATTGYATLTARLYDYEGGPARLEATMIDTYIGGTPPWRSGYAGVWAMQTGTYDYVNTTFDNIRASSIPSILAWRGSVNGLWDVNTTANFSGNWSGRFSDGDQVTFDDASSNTTVAIAEDGVAPGSVVFSNTAAKGYALSGGPIKGATSLVVSGGGKVTLSGASTYTGETTVSAGRLLVNSPGSLGPTAVTVQGGAALGGTGAIAGSVTVAAGSEAASQGTIDLVDNTIGGVLRFTGTNPAATVLTLGGTSGNYSSLNFDAGSTVDSIRINAGKLLINPGGARVNIVTTAELSEGDYSLITFADGQATNLAGLTLGTIGGPKAGLGFSLVTTGTTAAILHVGRSAPRWNVDGSGLWSLETNWAGGVPNGVGATATLGGAITSPQLVYMLTPVRVGTLTLDSTETYTVSGGAPDGTLTLEASETNTAAIQVLRGSHLINSPLTFASNTDIDVADSTTLTISDPVTVNAGKMIDKLGSGTLVLQSPWTGGSINVTAGTLEVAAANALSAGSALTIDAGGTVVLRSGLSATGASASAVPEPCTLVLLGIGAIGLLTYGWRWWNRAV